MVTTYTALTGDLPVTIAKPVKGETPQSAIAATTQYTGTIAWEGSPSTFAANTAYTAKVELTANTGYQFASDVNPTVAGADSVAGVKISNDGKTLTFDAKFPKTDTKTLKKLAVTAEPTTKSYTHGDNFNRAGMVVTATYDDMSTESITDYTVSYAAGSNYLKKGDTTVTLTKGGRSATVTGLTVGAKELTVPVTATNRGYESGNKEVTLTVGSLSGVVGSEEVKVANTTLTGTMADEKAGENKAVTVPAISLTGKDAGNYTVRPSGAVTVTIARKNLTAAMIKLGTQHTYNGNEQGVAISSVMDGTAPLIAGGHDYSIVRGNTATDVGDNTLIIQGQGNYTGTASATWSLVAKDVTITPNALSKTYGAADPELTYTTDISDTTLKAKLVAAVGTTKLGRATGDNVGMYAIKLGTLKAGNNFKLTLATTPVYLTITPADYTFTVPTEQSFRTGHGLSAIKAAPEHATGVNGETVNGTVKWYSDASHATLAVDSDLSSLAANSSKTLYWVFTPAGGQSNYKTDAKSGSTKFTARDKDDLSASIVTSGIKGLDKTYDGKGAAYTGKATVTGHTDIGNLVYEWYKADNTKLTSAPTEQGSYYLLVSIPASNDDYMGSAKVPFTITAKSVAGLTVTITGEPTYTGSPVTPATVTVKDGTTTLTKTADYTLGYSNNTNAGTATVTVKGQGNYTGEVDKTFKIKLAEVTAPTADGTTFTYNGTSQTYTPGGVDAATMTVSNNSRTDAGNQTVTVMLKDKNNYVWADTKKNADKTFNFTIDPKPLAADMFKDIAAVTYDGTAKTPTVTVAASETHLTTADFTVAYTSNTNAGTATVTITGKGNYTGTASKTFTINQKEVTRPTASTTAFTYTGTTQTYQPTGYDAAYMTISGNTATDAGTVTVTVRLKDTKNCKWAGGAADPTFSFTIAPKNISGAAVSVSGTFTYDGTAKTPAPTVTDGGRTLRSGTDYTVTYADNTNAGTAAKVTVKGQGNYTGTANGTFTINKRSLAFTATVASKIYDGNGDADASNFALVGVVGTDVVTVDTTGITAVFQDNSGKFDAGRYSVKVSGAALTGADAANYVLSSTEISVSNVEIQKLAADILPAGTTLKKGDAAKADAETAVGGLSAAAQEALKINELADNEKKLEAVKKAMAGKAGQSETNSQLLMLSGTGQLTLAYPDKVTSRFALKVTHLKSDGTIEVLTGVEILAAGAKLTASEGGLYLLSWKAPSSGGSGSGSSSYGSGAHTFTTDLTGINLVKVDNKVVPSKYYTVSGSDVTLSAEFMSTLSNGKHTIAIENATKVARATFTVSSNDKATYQPTSKEPTQAPGEIVKVTVDSGKATVTAVYVDGVKLSGKDYVLSGKTVKLQGTYTQKLSVGYHTLQVDYSNGATATARFEIKGAVVSPKTGDASVYLYAAMALMSGTGAAYVTLRRKKEN